MKKLSIIIPHYNSPRLLKKLLDSIPKNNEIQVIVVDDKSDKELKEYEEIKHNIMYKDITFTTNNKGNKGAGACRNIGLSLAIGEWILFADSDDYFIEGFYEKVSKYFESKNDIIYFIPTSIEIDTGNISDRHIAYESIILNYKNHKSLRNELCLKHQIPVPWSKLINRNIITSNDIKFDETIASNDVMFSAKVNTFSKEFDISEEVIYCVTRNKGSLTMNKSLNIFNIRLKVFLSYYKFLNENLTKEQFELLNLSGRIYIINAIRYKLGISKILAVYFLLKRNNIPVFNIRLLNPKIIIKRLMYYSKEYKKDSKYMIE